MTVNNRMAEFIKTHKMPDHTEQLAQEVLGAKPVDTDPDWIKGDPDPDTVIKVDAPEVMLAPSIDPQEVEESIEASVPVKQKEIPSSPKEEKHMDESFPKYQYSIFLGNAREEQLVIRADTWDEFITLKKNADAVINKVKERTPEVAPAGAVNPQYAPVQPVQPAADVPYCKIHGTPMKLKQGISKKTGKPYGPFWSCSERMPDGSYCPYKPE